MSAKSERVNRIYDLENAMRTIGRVLVNRDLTPKTRMQQALGILSLYDCAPPVSANPKAADQPSLLSAE